MNYITNIIGSAFAENDNKPFWKYIKSARNDSPGVTPLKKNGTLHADGASKVEILNDQFSEAFTKESPVAIPDPIGTKFPSIKNIVISVGGVAKLLRNIKPNKASDPDNIPCRILKELADETAPCLATIFQQSLDCGHLPEDWKTAQVLPQLSRNEINARQ